MLRVALPNKGQLSEPAKQMLAEAGLPAAARIARDLVIHRRGQRRRVLPAAARATSPPTSAAGTLDLGITGRDMLADSGADADEMLALGLRAVDVPSGCASRHGRPAGATCTATGSPPRTPRSCAPTSRRSASSASVVPLDGAVENAVRLGVADASPMSSTPARRCGWPAWRRSGSRSCTARRC